MIIDSHVHLKHGDAQKTEYSAAQIVRTMDAAGIDRSVVFAMSTTTPRAIAMAREAVAQFPDRLIAYAYALPHPERPILEDLDEAIAEFGFKGIKIHGGECRLAEYVIDPVLDLAGRRSVPCLIDFKGNDRDLERMAETFPQTRIIAAHLGAYLCTNDGLIERFITLAERFPMVYLDVSGVVLSWRIADAVRRTGAERVLWGTDGPHPKPDLAGKACLDLDQVRTCGISEDDQRAVLGGSIAGLLSL